MEFTRITVKYVEIPVTGTLANGDPATLAGVDVALLAPNRTPDATTVWTASTYAAGTATVLVAGPDADDADALVVPIGGADLWIKVTDSPEVDAEKVPGRITVR